MPPAAPPEGLLEDSVKPTTAQLAAEAARAAVAALGDQRANAYLESLNIVDPSTVRKAPISQTTSDDAVPASQEPEKVQPPAPPPKPTFSSDLLSRASQFGITPEEATAYGEPAHLERALSHINRTTRTWEPEPVADTSAPVVEEELPDLRQILDPETGKPAIDDRVLKVFDQLLKDRKELRQALGEMQGQLKSVGSSTEQIVRERHANAFDRFLSELPDEQKKLVGEGDRSSIKPGSPEWQIRSEIAGAADDLVAGRAARRQPALSEQEVLRRATAMVLSDKVQTTTREAVETEVLDRVRDTQGRFVAKPTHRAGKPGAADNETPPDDPAQRMAWSQDRLARNLRLIG